MNFAKIKLTAAVALALAVVIGTGAFVARAEKDEKPAPKKVARPTFTGTVKELDPDKGKVTLTRPTGTDKEMEDRTFTLSKDVSVVLEDVTGKVAKLPEGQLSDLKIGTHVTAQLSPDSKTVVSLSARGPTLHVAVKFADVNKRSVTYTTKTEEGPVEETVTLVEAAKVLLHDGLSKETADQEGKLADLIEGTSVWLQLTVDRQRVLSVRVIGKTIHASFKALDLEKSTITVIEKIDGQQVEKGYTLAKGVMIEGDPKENRRVDIRLSVFDPNIVTHVHGFDE